jgi:hypothetical protein
MSEKFYRVKKDNFLWKEGAILKCKGSGYSPIEDIWNVCGVINDEYISSRIIEHPEFAEYFERVYPDTITGKMFHTRDQLIAFYAGFFK